MVGKTYIPAKARGHEFSYRGQSPADSTIALRSQLEHVFGTSGFLISMAEELETSQSKPLKPVYRISFNLLCLLPSASACQSTSVRLMNPVASKI